MTAVGEVPLELEGPIVVPLREGALPVVRVALDGRSELSFVVDSGASLSSIDLGAAEELGLSIGSYGRATVVRGGGGGTVSFDSYACVERLEVGALELRGLRLPAIESPLYDEVWFAGVLGQDLLARLVVLFDMDRREIHLLPPAADDSSILSYLRENDIGLGTWTQVGVELRPRPFLRFQVDDRIAGELLIDTGGICTALPPEALDALALEQQATATSHAIDGTYEEEAYFLEDFEFLGFPGSCEVRRSKLEHGRLGMDILEEFIFVLDGPGEEMWIHHREFDREEAEAGD